MPRKLKKKRVPTEPNLSHYMPKKNAAVDLVKEAPAPIIKKDSLGRWVKGQSGNPKGRPGKGESLTEILREYGHKEMTLRGKKLPLKEHLAHTVYMAVILGHRLVENKKITLNDAVWADILKWLYDRVDGKPTENLRVGSSEVEITSEDMAAATQEVAEWKAYREKKNS